MGNLDDQLFMGEQKAMREAEPQYLLTEENGEGIIGWLIGQR